MPGLMKILIVGDETFVADRAAGILTDAGYDIVGIAHDMAAALSRVQRQSPDMVITGIRIGSSQDGIDAATEIMKAGKTPILFAARRRDAAVLARLVATSRAGVLPGPHDSSIYRLPSPPVGDRPPPFRLGSCHRDSLPPIR
ncbi:MAG TPA: response regulator [Ferrovibrio sp.]|uniref:response regulator n=1 Tax=Ferrovibrio sp. TaxID=1917215 RepID=UPI002ED34AEF